MQLAVRSNQDGNWRPIANSWRGMTRAFLTDRLDLLALCTFGTFIILTDSNPSGRTLIELKIARAYVKLSSIPEDDPQASVLLASIGSSEIRMLRGPEAHPDGVPLFWLELFDDRTQSSVDSFICHTLKDAVPVLEDFLSQAARQSKGLDDH